MSDTKKRTWKGYFIEFIMLFLAVSFVFLADNYREQISDRTKEKEYIQSMIEDAKEDRVNINEVINRNTQRSENLDSLINICFKEELDNRDKIGLNKHLINILLHPEFITPTELTMQQLKNAGGMRLIKSKEAINEIIRYDSKAKKIANQQLYYENYQNKAIDMGTKIFNIQALIANMRTHNSSMRPEDFELIDDDNLKLKQFGNSITMYKGIIDYYVTLLIEMDVQGEVLIQTLKDQYELE